MTLTFLTSTNGRKRFLAPPFSVIDTLLEILEEGDEMASCNPNLSFADIVTLAEKGVTGLEMEMTKSVRKERVEGIGEEKS